MCISAISSEQAKNSGTQLHPSTVKRSLVLMEGLQPKGHTSDMDTRPTIQSHGLLYLKLVWVFENGGKKTLVSCSFIKIAGSPCLKPDFKKLGLTLFRCYTHLFPPKKSWMTSWLFFVTISITNQQSHLILLFLEFSTVIMVLQLGRRDEMNFTWTELNSSRRAGTNGAFSDV